MTQKFERLLEDVLRLIKGKKDYQKEREVTDRIIFPVLSHLGWPTHIKDIVKREQRTRDGKRVDFSLRDNEHNARVFIEVKRLGLGDTEASKTQALNYALAEKIPLVVLTDGRIWSFFYLPSERSDYEERCFCKLDLLESSIQKSCDILREYLNRKDVISGWVVKVAERVFDEKKLQKEARRTIPDAWTRILNRDKGDPLLTQLIEGLAEEVEDRAVVRPDDSDIVAFLHSLKEPVFKSGRQDSSTPMPKDKGSKREKRKGERNQRERSGELVIHGESFHYKNPTDAMVIVFKELERREPGFYQRFYNDSRNRNRSNTRRIIAQDARGLYNSDNPRYKKAYKQLGGGWIISTYNSKQTIEKFIKRAADVAGLKFRKDIIVNFDDSLQRQERQVPAPPPSGASGGGRSGELVILGKSFPYKNPTDAMVTVFKELERRKPGFCQRFYNDPRNHGRTRRIIAQDARKLYDHAHLAKHHERIDSNWVISTNYNKQTIEKIIGIAVDVAGLEFGKDISINQSQERQVPVPPPSGASGGGRGEMLVICGKSFPCKNPTDAMVKVFKELERREPGFYQRFYNHPWNHRKTRRIIAQDAKELYDSENPRYKRAYKQLGGGWVISTYDSKKTIERNIRRAAEVAGLEFGRDLIINFDD